MLSLKRCLEAAVAFVLLGTSAVGMAEEGAGQKLPRTAERGQYLVNLGNCKTCHTLEGGQAFAGGVKFVTPFGTLYSTNITQDEETGIGSWSLEDFRNAMRKGVRPDGEHLYPVFPYTYYTRLRDDDIASIYAYLKKLPPVKEANKPNELAFPFNQRGLMAVWNALFFEEGEYAPDNSQSPDWNRGAYLVEGLTHCGLCHTPRNFLGAERRALALSGATYVDEIGEGKYRHWSAVNLTPARGGLAAWNRQDIVDYLTTGLSERAISYGPMNDVIMNSTRHLTETDAQSVATYLTELPAIEHDAGTAPDEEVMRTGRRLYGIHCGTCHLPTGLGGEAGEVDDGIGIALAGSATVQAADPSSMINKILYSPLLVPPSPFESGRKPMKSFYDKLSDEEVAQISTYVRNSWGNRAPPVSAEEVSRQRGAR